MRRVATYIDLNAVRAKIVADPSKYRWCGYAEACWGVPVAVTGIEKLLPPSANGKAKTGAEALREYRARLGGQAPQAETAFPTRVCRFTDGLALGSEKYIDAVRMRTELVRESPGFVPLPSGKDKICALRRSRQVAL